MSETSVNPLGGFAAAGAAPAIAILATQAATLAAAAGATVPSGAAVVVAATDVVAIAAGLCNPVSFFAEAGEWVKVASYCSAFTEGLAIPMDDFSKAWKGAAAASFQDYFNNRLSPVFPKLASLAEAEKALLEACGWAVITAAISFTTFNIPLFITAMALNGLAGPTFGASLAGHWPATAGWAGLVLAAAGFEVKLFMDINKQLDQVRNAGESLSNYVNSSTSNLGGNNLKAPDLDLPSVTAGLDELSGVPETFGPAQ